MADQKTQDPMKVDARSGVEHASVFSIEESQALLSKVWGPMVDSETHLTVRRFHDEADGPVEGIVIIARGDAARMLSEFTPTIPSFKD